MSSVSKLVEKLKENGEDFEFYPTTTEIINKVLGHMDSRQRHHRSFDGGAVLDVGAGRGDFLKAVGERFSGADLLAIERSPILMAELVKFAKVVGTDFHAQSFMSKDVKVIFCNPPYSEYATWAARLIKECPARDIYLVIPRRWKENADIQAAITFRAAEVSVLGSFDFEEGERKARAKVDVLHVYSDMESDELFDKFFGERFANLRENFTSTLSEEDEKKNAEIRQGLVEREGLLGALVELYDQEMARLQTNYDKAASLDASLLCELGLSISAIVTTLREKLNSLKDRYWSELFTNLDTVTKRLTAKNRRTIMEKIGGFKAVDFTRENAYAVILWVMENANQYVDKQILSVFDDMVDSANVHNYKSNQRVYGKGSWRYNQKPEDLSHISLDYRIVIDSHYRGMTRNYCGTYLSEAARDFIADMLTVANLLGFDPITDDARLTESHHYGQSSQLWKAGKAQLFKTLNGDDLVEVRCFLNGNMHVRMSQKFCLALNVAVGKLRGWLRDHGQASAEFGPEAEEHFARDVHMAPRQLLLGVA